MVNSFLLFSAPFTIQRLCELMVEPRKNYSNSEKFMRGVEKVRDNQSYNKLWRLLFRSLVCKTQSCQNFLSSWLIMNSRWLWNSQ